ncbi:SGNH/GDSL hydrolase family protein [Paenibacillus sp. MBLB4367]|uniref:SGNH/GDSL hydrolase family protein n=1 Tax=Paenibacillus sp. MBLB4367 TaxID=3384767 RepID=UPI003908356B
MRPFDLLLPSFIPAVVGKEMNIYLDNLITGRAGNYEFEVYCEIGRLQDERWTVVPEAGGDYALTILLYSLNGEKLSSAESTVRVAEQSAGRGVVNKALFIGDSLTANGAFTGELLRLTEADPLELALAGTQGASPNVHEGRSGWKVESHYEGGESTFQFDGTFDFVKYMHANGFGGLTHVGITLGINDVFLCLDDDEVQRIMDREMPMLEAMVRGIKQYDAGIMIGIMLNIPPSREQHGFGLLYGTKQSRRRYKRNIFLWNRELTNRFGSREAEGIALVPINVNLDTANNMPLVWEAVNSRNSKQILRKCDDVHPAVEGYYQLADVIYYWLKTLAADSK